MSDNRTNRDRRQARASKTAGAAWLTKRADYLLNHPELLHTVSVTR